LEDQMAAMAYSKAGDQFQTGCAADRFARPVRAAAKAQTEPQPLKSAMVWAGIVADCGIVPAAL
jgi:hypothetical protein